ncbi:MAG: hypothetical protein Aurels2KO_40150 [Aureliella sp.]
MNDARSVTADRFGWIYVGDRSGLLRFDGTRWHRVYSGRSVLSLETNGQNCVYGLLEDGVGKWDIASSPTLRYTSFESPILEAGLKSAAAFRDLSRVGNRVYATKTEAIARMEVTPEGEDRVTVIRAAKVLPREYKFRRVREVQGRAMVQVERRSTPWSSRFGWLNDDGSVELLDYVKLVAPEGTDLTVLDFCATTPESSQLVVIAASASTRYVATFDGREYKFVGTWADWQPLEYCRFPLHIKRIAADRFIITARNDGAAIINTQGEELACILPEEIPGSSSSVHLGVQGRIWFPISTGVVRFHTQPSLRVWDLPQSALVNAIASFEGTLVAGTARGIYQSTLESPDRLPTDEFKYVGDSTIEVTRLRVINDRLFICQPNGLYYAENRGQVANPLHVPGTKIAHAFDVIEGTQQDEIIACYNGIGCTRTRFIDGKWQIVSQFLSGLSVWDVAKDSAGVYWFNCSDNLDRRTIQRVELGEPGSEKTKEFAVTGVPFTLGDRTFVFSHAGPAETLGANSPPVIREYDPQRDLFVESPSMAGLAQFRPPVRFHPALSRLSTSRLSNGDLIVSGGTSSLLRVSLDDSEKLSIKPILESISSSTLKGGIEGEAGVIWAGAANQILCRVPRNNSRSFGPAESPAPRVLLTRTALVGEREKNEQTDLASNPREWDESWNRAFSYDFTTKTLVIDFSVSAAFSGQKVFYQTRMIGIRDSWSEPTKRTHREYPALYGGDYTFQVRAILPDGTITPVSTCEIEVFPPWYATTAFKVCAALSVVLACSSLVWWRIRMHQRQVATLQREVTDRIEAEQQLQATQNALLKQERLRAFGELAASVAHDVNNALAPVAAFSELITIHDTASSEVRKMASHVNNAAKDAAGIIRRIQPLYWSVSNSQELVDLSALVEDFSASARAMIIDKRGSKSTIRIITDTHPVDLWCSAAEIREVLLNLLSNAIQAIDPGSSDGTIRLACSEENGQAIVSVSDNGSGMDETTLAACFSTFFSTREERGSGLGLSTSRAIVQSYGGRLSVESKLGEGTTFRFAIPTNQDARRKNVQIDEGPKVHPAPLHVLLVEDIATTRDAIASLLHALGHTVKQASDAEQAIEILDDSPEIKVVLTDYGLPGISGTDLSNHVHRLRPELRVILMTGHELPAMRELADAVIAKPVSLNNLRQALASEPAEPEKVKN